MSGCITNAALVMPNGKYVVGALLEAFFLHFWRSPQRLAPGTRLVSGLHVQECDAISTAPAAGCQRVTYIAAVFGWRWVRSLIRAVRSLFVYSVRVPFSYRSIFCRDLFVVIVVWLARSGSANENDGPERNVRGAAGLEAALHLHLHRQLPIRQLALLGCHWRHRTKVPERVGQNSARRRSTRSRFSNVRWQSPVGGRGSYSFRFGRGSQSSRRHFDHGVGQRGRRDLTRPLAQRQPATELLTLARHRGSGESTTDEVVVVRRLPVVAGARQHLSWDRGEQIPTKSKPKPTSTRVGLRDRLGVRGRHPLPLDGPRGPHCRLLDGKMV